MNIKRMIITAAAAVLFTAGSAFAAPVTQSTALASSDSGPGSWTQVLLGSVTFASGTNSISALTSIATAWDQGWGNYDPASNQVIVALYENATYLWGAHVAGGTRPATTQAFDISTDTGLLNSLNAAIGGVDWSGSPTVTMRMLAAPLGYYGWELHVRNATFSVTSDVPEPTTLALLGLGLAGLGFARRRKQQQAA